MATRLDRLLSYIARDAGNLGLRKEAAREAFDTGRWDMARELIATGLHARPEDPELLALSGFACLQAQRYAEAERALASAVERGIESAEVRYNLAFSRFQQKRYGDALEVLTTSVSQDLPGALLLRARCLHHLERPAEAIAECRVHLDLAPHDADTNGLLALLLHERGRNEDAKKYASIALAASSKQLDAMLASASMQAQAREYDTARGSFDALLQAHPECGRGWLGLGLIEVTQMRMDAARRHVELAAVHMPEHVGTWHVLAWIHIMLRNIGAAQTALERALSIDRNFAETHGGLAVVAALQGSEDDARRSLRRALKLDPKTLSAHYAEMLLLQRRGKHGEAAAVLEAFLDRSVDGGNECYRDQLKVQLKSLSRLASELSAPVSHH